VTIKLFAAFGLTSGLFAQSALPDGNVPVDQMKQQYVKVWRTLMAPKNVADAFGKRIAKRYIAMQITIANRNSDYQWLIQDASINLSKLMVNLQQPGCAANLNHLLSALKTESDNPNVTSADLTVLRGVAEKGLVLDGRNLGLRILTGVGTIAGGLTGFGPSIAPGVAVFNGPVLSAYQSMFPDFTINQLNRLNDSAFIANTVVGKQQARVIVIFLPMEYLLTKDQAKKFYSNPETVFGCPDLRLLEADADGNFITAVAQK